MVTRNGWDAPSACNDLRSAAEAYAQSMSRQARDAGRERAVQPLLGAATSTTMGGGGQSASLPGSAVVMPPSFAYQPSGNVPPPKPGQTVFPPPSSYSKNGYGS